MLKQKSADTPNERIENVETTGATPVTKSLLSEAREYRDRGRIPIPLSRADSPDPKRAGKAPILKKLDYPGLSDCGEDYLEKHWGGPRPLNLGVILESPHVVIDLDSKPDKGASVRAWMESHPEILKWPREKTRGGVHVHVRCEDIPVGIQSEGGKRSVVTRPLNDQVDVEIFFGGVITVSPSEHRDGGQYEWEREGEPPLLAWSELCSVLGISPEARKKPQKSDKSASRFKGDLRSLDIVNLCRELDILGELLDEDSEKYAVKCPWRDHHSDSDKPWDPSDPSTVIWGGVQGTPSFYCLHNSHGEKGTREFLEWADGRYPGIVDRYCSQMSAEAVRKDKPFIQLPGENRLTSEFAADVGDVLSSKQEWFNREEQVVAVRKVREIVKSPVKRKGETEKPDDPDYTEWTAFVPVDKHSAVTGVESFLTPGVLRKSEDESGEGEGLCETPKSMGVELSKTLLESFDLKTRLPRVERIFEVPMPLVEPRTGDLVSPEKGHDPRFNSYMVPSAPGVREMPLGDAKGMLEEVLRDFCFRGKQDVVHATAALITPMCRGLYDRWTARTPVFFFLGNRPRTGKDYLAGCVSMIYEGRTNEDPPLDQDHAELRKKLTSALMSGRRRMHFSNCSGILRNGVFEQVVTNERWTDRVLGGNNELTLPNEMEFSLSGNTGVIYSPDFNSRTRVINLHFAEENENHRVFSKPDLHGWILRNRESLISSIWSLVRNWDERGRPSGSTPFTSFPSWASVVGGIMDCAGLGDPCLPHELELSIGGDTETRDMKALFVAVYEAYPDKWVSKSAVRKIVERSHQDDSAEPLFGFLDMGEHSSKVRFGRILDKFVGREFDEIRMEDDASTDRKDRRKLRFSKVCREEVGVNPVADVFGLVDSESPSHSEKSGGLGGLGGLPTPEYPEAVEKGMGIREPEYIDGAEITAKTARTSTWDLIEDAGLFSEIAKEIRECGKAVALDLETYGSGKTDALKPFKGQIRLLVLRIPDRAPWIVDLKETGYDLGELGQALENSEVIIHNALFDLRFLGVHCGVRPKKVVCTMTASKLLKAGKKPVGGAKPNSLGEVLREYCIADLEKELGASDWGGELSEDQLQYAADDVNYLHGLREELEKDIEASGLSKVWKLESELLPVVVRMFEKGIYVDRDRLKSLRDQLSESIKAKAREVCEELGQEINLNSTKQLREALEKVGLKLEKTDKGTLSELDHPVGALILDYRGEKSKSSNVESMSKAIGEDDRIHGTFDPSGADSGRISCKEPNLQSVGRGSIRESFMAPAGRKLVCADYSQIELRIAAVVRGEEKMLEAYRDGKDLHRLTASLIVGKALDEVEPEERQMAKAVNFGLLYGQGAEGLARYAKGSYGVDMPVEDAERFRDRFFEGYPGMKAYDEKARSDANSVTCASTRLGRKRHFNSFDTWWNRYTGLLNSPIQGGAADVFKTALVALQKVVPEGVDIVSNIHDEILLECPESRAGEIQILLEAVMKKAMADLYPEVPCEVEARVGDSWAEAK